MIAVSSETKKEITVAVETFQNLTVACVCFVPEPASPKLDSLSLFPVSVPPRGETTFKVFDELMAVASEGRRRICFVFFLSMGPSSETTGEKLVVYCNENNFQNNLCMDFLMTTT